MYLLNSVHTQWSHSHYIMALYTSCEESETELMFYYETEHILCITPKYSGAWLSKSFVTQHILGLLTKHWGQSTNVLLSSFGSVSMSLSPSVFLCHMSPQHKLCKTRSSLQINRAQAQALSGQGRGWTRRLHTGHKQGNISYITTNHVHDSTLTTT